MKVNWIRVTVCACLSGLMAGVGMPIYVGVIGFVAGFLLMLGIEWYLR